MKELISADYKVLKFIKSKGKVGKTEIQENFPEENFLTECRLESLFRINYIDQEYWTEKTDLGSVRHEKEIYFLTMLGKKTLQDYEFKIKEEKDRYLFRDLPLELMRSILCPLVVAFVTAVITSKFFT